MCCVPVLVNKKTVKICDLGILGKRYFKMCIDCWIPDTQHLEIGRHAAELSLMICKTVAKQAGAASLCRLVVDLNPEVFANGIDNVLWYSTRRDVEEFRDNAL